jgi:hypothetical protein
MQLLRRLRSRMPRRAHGSHTSPHIRYGGRIQLLRELECSDR